MKLTQENSDVTMIYTIEDEQRRYCDVLKDESNYTVNSQGFQVSIRVQNDPNKKLVKLSADAARARGVEIKAEAGFAAFVAPTCCPYELNVIDKNGEKFTIESIKVGDEAVIVNNGGRLFYTGTTTISSFSVHAT